MKKKITTSIDLLQDSKNHQCAIKVGNSHFSLWQRNVADHLKEKSTKDICEHLSNTSNNFSVLFENVINDFNMATGIRNANAFNASKVFYIGDKRWDKRGSVGVTNYTKVEWIDSQEYLVSLKNKYFFVGVDNIACAKPINDYNWSGNQKQILVLFGEEGVGLTKYMQNLCDEIVFIQQYGSVRSLNVGTASGIIMFDLVNKLNANKVRSD